MELKLEDNLAQLSVKLETELKQLKRSASLQRRLSSHQKNNFLVALAGELKNKSQLILETNQLDLNRLPESTPPAFRDRLLLNPFRIESMVESILKVAHLEDPVGEIVEEKTLANQLKIKKVRGPLGIILLIFESRPNVITEAFSLAFKSGNLIILRGGSDSQNSCGIIYEIIRQVAQSESLPFIPFIGIEDYDKNMISHLLKRSDLIDIVVPRGGSQLIEFVQNNSRIPIIKNDRGLCHIYVHEDADLEMAVKIVVNAKTQRPGVCNSMETLLVHKSIAPLFLDQLYEATLSKNLKWKVDMNTAEILKNRPNITLANLNDWDTEHLDLIMNCHLVEDIEEAMTWIDLHGSKHSEAIITESKETARIFQDEVDAAAVYWNASTRFTDGYEMGLGGELGISTQKLHVRGPVGLKELTTPRWIIDGNGQVR